MTRLVWEKVVWGFLALAGIWFVINGLTAEKFTDRTLGWLPGQEKLTFNPRWYHRAFVVLMGSLITIYAACAFIGVHWKR